MYYEYRVAHRTPSASRIAFACGVAGMVCFAGGNLLPAFGGLAQTAALGFFCATVLFLSRYTLRNYLYRICIPEPGDDWPAELAVVELKGKRRTVVAQIRLAQITELVWETAEDRAACKERFKGRKQYTYTVDFRPERTLCILCNDGSEASGYTDGDDLLLRLSPDDTVTAYLERALSSRPDPASEPS
jgi:hypothetical protein